MDNIMRWFIDGSIWFTGQNIHVVTMYDNVPVFPLKDEIGVEVEFKDPLNVEAGIGQLVQIAGQYAICVLWDYQRVCGEGWAFQWYPWESLQS